MNLSVLLPLAIVLGAFVFAGGGLGAGGSGSAQDVAALVRKTEEANQALVRGDIAKYIELNPHAKDYLLMNPFGGTPTRGFDDSPERRAGMAKFFKSGTH
jgi:hypothetical protein